MNKQRREKLGGAMLDLDNAIEKITDVSEEEQESYDCLPESLQYSERADKMQEAIAYLDEALCSINEANDSIREAME